MTLPTALDKAPAKVEEIRSPQDLFVGLEDGEVLSEPAAPSEIKTALRR